MNIYAVIVSFFLFLALLAALFVIVYQSKLHYKEKEDLHLKLASKSLDEAEYYRKEYPKIVAERIKKMETDRTHPPSPEETRKAAAAGRF